jgi:hypothetical protein
MSYLYGDSAPSSLEVNFIDFLRDSLDFCVKVAVSTDGLKRETERGEALRQATRRDVERLDKLGAAVASTIESFCNGEADVPIAGCALAVAGSTRDLVSREIQAINSALEIEEAKIAAARAAERESCVKALSALLLRHDLPESTASMHLKARANAPYAAELRATTPLGVTATLELDVPPAHLFGHVIRVDRVLDRLEIQAPELAGWLHKERKMRAQRLEKLHVIELYIGAGESSLALRAGADGSGPGFDILLSAEAPRARLSRVPERDGSSEPPFELSEEDAQSLLALLGKLESAAQELADSRKALLSATLDDRPFGDHDAPTVLIERLVQVIAPVVHEIAVRSPSPTELVLKRQIDGGVRQEIFVAKSELREKVERVPTPFRPLFDALRLGDERPGRPSPNPTPSPLPSRVAAPRGSEPFAVARRASGSDARAEDAARPGDGPPQDVTLEQIDAGFQVINVGETPIAK